MRGRIGFGVNLKGVNQSCENLSKYTNHGNTDVRAIFEAE